MLDAQEISMLGAVVRFTTAVLRGTHTPPFKKQSSTLFSFVATVAWKPCVQQIMAMWHAKVFPKLPEGMW
ncbi:hypothetical protein [Candidatus Tremblaya princeps]|uniref:hypothetical protein n=1 Tax=Tremblaya princeps TaxID=189385 RepID=UPI001FE0E5E1|nr:hypothetical protein [Candidatus Tremblaya princeps]